MQCNGKELTNMKDIMLIGGISVSFITLVIKNNHTYKLYKTMLKAIFEYQRACSASEVDSIVSASDMTGYVKSVLRIWDWGYTNILPKDKFELVKPFMKGK